jgi:hypothetical protein
LLIYRSGTVAGASRDRIRDLVRRRLGDETAPLAGLRRLVKPGGQLIGSVNHPIQCHPLARPE